MGFIIGTVSLGEFVPYLLPDQLDSIITRSNNEIGWPLPIRNLYPTVRVSSTIKSYGSLDYRTTLSCVPLVGTRYNTPVKIYKDRRVNRRVIKF